MSERAFMPFNAQPFFMHACCIPYLTRGCTCVKDAANPVPAGTKAAHYAPVLVALAGRVARAIPYLYVHTITPSPTDDNKTSSEFK